MAFVSIDVENLIPHRKPLKMVEQIVSYDDASKSSVIELNVDENSPFTSNSGLLDGECFLEIIAQAAAAQHGFNLRRLGSNVEKGFLVGAMDFKISGQARVKDKLIVKVECGTE